MDITIPTFEKARILVFGDLMLDRYWHGTTQRISPEAPVPIVQLQSFDERAGGAGNVAMNLVAVGAHVTVMGVVGNDEAADILLDKLSEAHINTRIHRDANQTTTTKIRILSQQQQLIRLDFEKRLSQFDFDKIIQEYIDLLPDFNAVIISDYGKGTVQDPQPLIQAAKRLGIPILVDPKGNDFSKYRHADIITPNRKEFEQAIATCHSETDLEIAGQRALAQLDLTALLITRGQEGMSLIRNNLPAVHVPAKALEVRDVTGAGDTVIAILAASIAAGEDIINAIKLANIAAGFVVTKLGAAAITEHELREIIHETHSKLGLLTEDELLLMRHAARLHNEKIVMTNGCFDILHPGHIGYLEEAKALGDRLIVAVNDDESIRRNKGSGRPVQSLQERMSVLAGLRAVDWVVAFSEDTPDRLIKKISPDILVKGVDYKGQTIVGADHVLQQGGEVHFVGPAKEWSSSEIIEKLKKVEIE